MAASMLSRTTCSSSGANANLFVLVTEPTASQVRSTLPGDESVPFKVIDAEGLRTKIRSYPLTVMLDAVTSRRGDVTRESLSVSIECPAAAAVAVNPSTTSCRSAGAYTRATGNMRRMYWYPTAVSGGGVSLSESGSRFSASIRSRSTSRGATVVGERVEEKHPSRLVQRNAVRSFT